MNINENNKFQLIDDYLKGGMSQDEIDSFRAFMQSDKDLALDAAITMEIEEASAFRPIESQLRDTLGNIRREKTGANHPSTTKNNTVKLAVIAAVLGLLTYFFISLFGQWNTSQSTDTYQQYAMVEPLELSTKSNQKVENLLELQSSYNQGNYTDALMHINSYLAIYPRDLDVLLAKGIAMTETGSYDQAHKVYATIAALNPRVQKYKWYDALTYIKEGKVAQAKVVLTDISSSKSYNYEQAESLLTRLK